MIPCALIASCLGLKADNLVKSILQVNELPASNHILENIFSYPWHINTKYYTADINLCITNDRTIGNREFAKSVGAIVITFDTNQASSFSQVKMWLPYLKEIESPVQILVCDRSADDDVIPRRSLISWCLDNAFELVELNPVENDDGSDEDEFKESFGIQRIVEALKCHSWSNMVMKEKPSYRSPYFEKLMSDAAAANKAGNFDVAQDSVSAEGKQQQTSDASSNALPATDLPDGSVYQATLNGALESEKMANKGSQINSQQIIDSMISDLQPDAGADKEEESFEKLFEKLNVMKDAASNLPPDQRKEYAKQITIQFWKAIGGSPEEIEGLSDEDS